MISWIIIIIIYLFLEEEADPCHPNPCQNNGLCVPQPNTEFYCNCTEPFKAPLCIGNVKCNLLPIYAKVKKKEFHNFV